MTFLICVLFKILNISTSSLVFMFLRTYMLLRFETNNKNIFFIKTVLTSLKVILKSQWIEDSKKTWILGCSLVQYPHRLWAAFRISFQSQRMLSWQFLLAVCHSVFSVLRTCICAEPRRCPLSVLHFKPLFPQPLMSFMDEQARSTKVSHCHSPLNLSTL